MNWNCEIFEVDCIFGRNWFVLRNLSRKKEKWFYIYIYFGVSKCMQKKKFFLLLVMSCCRSYPWLSLSLKHSAHHRSKHYARRRSRPVDGHRNQFSLLPMPKCGCSRSSLAHAFQCSKFGVCPTAPLSFHCRASNVMANVDL